MAIAASLAVANASAQLIVVKAVFGNLAKPAATSNVTAMVAGMVANNTLEVLASTNNFGEPAQNMVKELTVDYTLNGKPGSKTAVEDEWVRISAEAKVGSTRLVIRKAEFGDLPDGSANDVTTNIAAMVEDDALDVFVSSFHFGDPAKNKKKRLRVDYAFDGEERAKTVVEGGRLRISSKDQSAGSQKFTSSRLFIREAEYGDLPKGNINDVTAIVAAMVQGDELDLEVGKFDDPAPNIRKRLRVAYTFDGEEREKTVLDRDRLKISVKDQPAKHPASSSSRLVIQKAEYGDLPNGNFNDITAIIAGLVEHDELDVLVGSFDDPAPNIRKKLHVTYTFDGEEGSKSAIDKARLKISFRDKKTVIRTSSTARLVIRAAVFGDSLVGGTNDVTAIVAAMVTNNVLDVLVNTNLFDDPAPGVVKQLRVDYLLDGKDGYKTAVEKGRLRISPSVQTGSARLVIRNAVYGDLPDGRFADVTTNVAGMIEDDTLNVFVGNINFGDPAGDKKKHLRVDYTFDGVEKSRSALEGTQLKISLSDSPTSVPERRSAKLGIRSAIYGDFAHGDTNDVTAIVATMVTNDALDFIVGDFDDPAPKVIKELRVDYIYNGTAGSKTALDNDRFQIPGNSGKAGQWILLAASILLVLSVGAGLMIRKGRK